MKTVNRILRRVNVVFVLLMLIGCGSALGNVLTAPNDTFSITTDNTLNSSGWNLKYSASENAFKITLVENNGEKEFMVRSKFFEVAYVLNKNGFGARMIKPGKAQVPVEILNQIMNKDALKQQKVISNTSITNETALNLIASYMPDLINNNYKQLLQ